MKSNFINYFKNGKLIQTNKENTIYTITSVNTDLEFTLDKTAMDLLLKFNNPTLSLNKTLHVVSNQIEADIPLSVLAFNALPQLKEEALEFALDIEILKKASYFAAPDSKNPILRGVNISNKRINATDSFSAFSTEIEDLNEDVSITIPKEFIDEISKVAKGVVNFKTDKKIIYCEIEGIEYYSVLYDGNFPPVKKVFESAKNNNTRVVQANKQELLSILSFASSGTATLSDYLIKLRSEFINMQSMCDLNMGADVSIVLNTVKLKTALENCVDLIEMSFNDAKSPVLLNDTILLLPITQQN